MRTRLTLRPGQKGTKKLVAQYGDRLVAVRYRYDEKTGARWKTVELIVEEVQQELSPPPPVSAIAQVRVLGYEKELRERVKAAGGRWRPDTCVWEVDSQRVRELGLEARIVGQEGQHM